MAEGESKGTNWAGILIGAAVVGVIGVLWYKNNQKTKAAAALAMAKATCNATSGYKWDDTTNTCKSTTLSVLRTNAGNIVHFNPANMGSNAASNSNASGTITELEDTYSPVKIEAMKKLSAMKKKLDDMLTMKKLNYKINNDTFRSVRNDYELQKAYVITLR